MRRHMIVLTLIYLCLSIATISKGGECKGILETVELRPIADSDVRSTDPNSNYGGSSYLDVWRTDGWSESISSAYLMFDVSNVSSVTSAVLKLYTFLVDETYSIGVHYSSNNSWTELGITYSNAPTYSETASIQIVGFKSTWYSWDVTDFVRESLSSGRVTLVVTGEDVHGFLDWTSFYSKDQQYSWMEKYRPVLEINGKLETETITPKTTPKITNVTETTSGAQVTIVFSGTDSATNTELFELYGYSRFTWTCDPYASYGDLDIGVYSINSNFATEYFSGVKGEGYFYEAGLFYLDITAIGVNSWEIRIEHLKLPEPKTTWVTATTIETVTTQKVETIVETITTEKTMQEIGTPVLTVCVLFAVLLALNQHRKIK